ncbi:MAG: hypothetical protein JJE09_11375, partial [Bacteroidia bacterium]|nr:hypothetical protein [Bacteroidia bacterium]
IIVITFISIFFQLKKSDNNKSEPIVKMHNEGMDMSVDEDKPAIKPRVINLIVPLLSVIVLSVFLFWFFGKDKPGNNTFISALTNTEPNRAMLVALFISIIISALFYLFQGYNAGKMTADIITGGNAIMTTLIILTLAWPLASVSQELGLNNFIQQYIGSSLPAWGVAVSLFLLSSAVTYFIGSGWGAASLIMPFAIPLAVSVGSGIPLCVAAVITGGTFGDVTSPVAGMTNMASNISNADHAKYLQYARPYNFIAAGVAAALFLLVSFF